MPSPCKRYCYYFNQKILTLHFSYENEVTFDFYLIMEKDKNIAIFNCSLDEKRGKYVQNYIPFDLVYCF